VQKRSLNADKGESAWMNRIKNILLLILVAVAVSLLLTGCFKFSIHLTVNKNGTADVDIIMAASQALVTMGAGLESGIFGDRKEQLAEQGFAISDYYEGNMAGFRAIKRVESVKDFSSLGFANDLGLDGQEIFSVEKHALTTTYHLNAELNFGDLFAEDSDRMALFSPDMRFILTLPIKPLEHNATTVSADGKTLEWQLSPTKRNEIKLIVRTPNLTSIVIGSAAAVLLLGLIPAGLIIRKRRAGSPAGRTKA
jgi:hypothetical protein